jgi:ACS family hexuronate transporter-like MFS transporter
MDAQVLKPRALIVLIGLLLAATTINYIDRQVLSVLAPVLRNEFSLSNSQYAAVVNAFMITYGFAMPAAGWLLDRIGVARGFTLSVLWWSAAGMLTAFARGQWSLAALRSLLAVGEAGAWPGFAKTVAAWVPVAWRPMAMGVCNSGSSLGAVIAPPLVVFLATAFHWQAAFLVTGALGFVWVICFRLFLRAHPVLKTHRAGVEVPGEKMGWREVAGYRQVWGIFACRFFADPLWYFYIFWIPEFLARERGLSLAQIGAVAWIPFLVADLSNVAAGGMALWLSRRGWGVNRVRKTLMVGGALISPAGVMAVFAPTVAATVAFICVAIFFWMIWSVTVQTLAGDLFPPEAVGSAYGIGGAGSTLGSVISIWAVGRTLDVTQSYVPVFAALGLAMPVALGVGSLLLGRVERLERRASAL